jgi:hypothetical protein
MESIVKGMKTLPWVAVGFVLLLGAAGALKRLGLRLKPSTIVV